MNKILSALIILLIFTKSYSQECPVIKDKELIDKFKVKSISIKFNSISNLEKHDGLEVNRFKFDEDGKITYEKYFRLFDVILYSEEYSYTYNNLGQLVEKEEVQTEFPKDKQDSLLLDISGYGPSKTKWTYSYDKNNRMIKELEYLKSSDENPTLSIIYDYDKRGNIIKEVFMNLNFPEQVGMYNRIHLYKYDKNGQLIAMNMNWISSDIGHKKTFKYDENGHEILESFIHNDGGYGNVKKYSYKENQLHTIERYKDGENEWFSKTIIDYNHEGCKSKVTEIRASGNEWIETFECNDKGLLKSEVWYTKEGGKAFSFETEYKYY